MSNSILAKSNPQVKPPDPPVNESHSRYQLIEKIITLSESNDWYRAKSEWKLLDIYIGQAGACLCGHFPILEHCILFNRLNGNEATVGNVCVTKFLDLESDYLFQSVRRIQKNPAASMSHELIEFAHSQGWMNVFEYKFCKDTHGKKKMSSKQIDFRTRINEKIIDMVRRTTSALRGRAY